MWKIIEELKESGVTIILTTHYIEEAEEIADRVGVINNGELILVEEKSKLMSKLGKKQVTFDLTKQLKNLPSNLSSYTLELSEDGHHLTCTLSTASDNSSISALLDDLKLANVHFRDLNTMQSSLEDIFVDLVKKAV